MVKQVAKGMCRGFTLLFLLSYVEVKEFIICSRLQAVPLLDVSNNWLDIFICATLEWSTGENARGHILWLLLKDGFSSAIFIALFKILTVSQ